MKPDPPPGRAHVQPRPPPLPAAGHPAVSSKRLGAAFALLAALVLYELAESTWWGRTLWGGHSYSFWPLWTWLTGPLALLVVAQQWVRSAADAKGGSPPIASPAAAPPVSAWVPWIAAAGAGLCFWGLRERHLFWGDSLPLSILIPQGQSFHPDEPLTLLVHHWLYQLGGGHWSGATAVAIGSAVSGAIFVGWSVRWWTRRGLGGGLGAFAAATLCTQGFTQIFYGHVENYSYLAVCLLFFFTLGVDFLEGRGDLLRPLLAALAAFAFHILGGLAALPAIVLVVHGLRDSRRRVPTLIAIAVVVAVALGLGLAVSGLYGGESPWSRFVGGAWKVLSNPTDTQPSRMLSGRRLADVWSEFVLLGPLSLPTALGLLAVLGSAAFLRRPAGAFLLGGSLAMLGPSLLTGAGNLGAARNWDLFAAPAVSAGFLGLERVAGGLATRQARRLLIALFAVSAFHTAPWVALNTRVERASARAAQLPLGGGRAPAMLGTRFLNAGDLAQAQTWFRLAVLEDSNNVNAQSGLGLALARQSRWSEAVAPMSAAVRIRPGSIEYRRDLAVLWLTLEGYDRAAPELRIMLEQDPHDRRSWLTLAECYMHMAQPDSAALAVETGLQYLPGDTEMVSALGDAYEAWVVDRARRRRWDEARVALSLFESRFPDDDRIARLRAGLP